MINRQAIVIDYCTAKKSICAVIPYLLRSYDDPRFRQYRDKVTRYGNMFHDKLVDVLKLRDIECEGRWNEYINDDDWAVDSMRVDELYPRGATIFVELDRISWSEFNRCIDDAHALCDIEAEAADEVHSVRD